MLETLIFSIYFTILLGFSFITYKKQKSNSDFILGNRSLNFWLTALSAHASDMSGWLFLAYPASIFAGGLFQAWTGIGLTVFMFLNWHFVAPKIRTATEKFKSQTLSVYFENRFGDTSGAIRTATAILSVLFFIIYVSAGLVGLGVMLESLLGFPYLFGITAGLLIVVASVFIGGYTTIAWIDLFQGLFLLAVIVFIPSLLLAKSGGMGEVIHAIQAKGVSISLFPDQSFKTWMQILFVSAGWGLGYFGQPHIITKFMGIKNVADIPKSKYFGICWQIIVLTAATLIGFLGIYFFPNGSPNIETVTLDLVKTALFPLIAGLALCAIVAATINVMAAQLLVAASNLSEDLYKQFFRCEANSPKLLKVSRLSVLLIGSLAYAIAYFNISSIYNLVHYAWIGLGASFGPLILTSLYSRSVNKYGACAGILAGGTVAAVWQPLGLSFGIGLSAMVPAFVTSLLAIFAVSYLTRKARAPVYF